ncbi:HlyD family efflux transporter periplasmic adaptor subunit [Pseudomaricurvus alkylphenolicus]|uniref:efflux RND transporter periplasmic adaptor subunit n=1 Tax=Pseudomaricurvus alkylphenolicus TaxID=1306991 RepID=UPI00141F4791|nr:efflux RND transporter periplasmic adaptor subunit [Pseudomaricurvus alkylphenolicus]NIB44505.1 HlyD family efflux transporter periplasmic adaptor subunit [Pseudomaricurvus alkylphenolicus]
MPLTASQPQERTVDGRTVLVELRSLRRFSGEEQIFWGRFTSLVAQLCHSPIALSIVVLDNGQLMSKATFGLPEGGTELESTLLSQISRLAGRADVNGFAHERAGLNVQGMVQPTLLVSQVESHETAQRQALALVVDRANSQQFNETIVRTQLVADIPAAYERHNRDRSEVAGHSDTHSLLATVLDVQALVQQHHRYKAAAIALVNELAARFGCSQVSLGWKNDEYMLLAAISHLERFERGTDAAKCLEAIFEESGDQDAELVWPDDSEGDSILVAHEAYARVSGAYQLVSLPLRDHDGPVGVVTLERLEHPFTNSELSALRLLTSQVQPWLSALESKDLWFGRKLLRWGRDKLSVWLGVEHTLAKFSALLAALLVLYVALGTWTYRVEVPASLDTDNTAYLSAPFDSYVHKVSAHSGDQVAAGDPLVVLDTEELLLKESEARADVNRYSREAEKARAKRAMADMRIAMARSEQAQSTLERVRYYLNQATIKAPFEGIIVEGDKDELLGAPVTKGDLIFKIVQISDLYIKMRLSERDVDEIQVGDLGELALLSRPEETIAIQVQQVIPVAEVESMEGNVFIVRATFVDGTQDWWRPGMSGLAKIDVGERNIFWILTHRTSDFLRMYFWW